MKIKNYNELATSPERTAALDILEAGLQAIDTETVMRSAVRVEGD